MMLMVLEGLFNQSGDLTLSTMIPCKILIVDDDADDREIISTTFHDLGISNFQVVSSAQAAFAFLQSIEEQENLPRLIITDLNMPGISGYELLQSLKTMQRYKHIPVIVYSTSNLKEDINKCLLKGALDYFTKPSLLSEYSALGRRVKELVPQ